MNLLAAQGSNELKVTVSIKSRVCRGPNIKTNKRRNNENNKDKIKYVNQMDHADVTCCV